MAIDFLNYFAGLTVEDDADTMVHELRVIEQMDAPLNQQFFDIFQESHPEPTTSTIMAVKPELTFRTHAWEALSICGYTGLASSYETPLTSTLWFRRAQNLGTREARDDPSHVRYQLNSFLMYITALRASFQTPAMCDLRLKPVWDGTTAPFTFGGIDGELPFTATPYNRIYTLSKIKLGSTVIDQHAEMQINFNPQMAELGADDDIYDSTCVLNSMRPEILLSGYDFDSYSTFGEAGPGTPASVVIFLRRKKENGTYYANNTSNHIRITITSNHWVVDKVGGAMNAPGMFHTRLRPLAYDVSSPMFDIDFDQQIS
jgi:hypothetical protein